MNDGFEFEIWQDGFCVASAWAADRDRALKEAMHYFSVYRQDGPTDLKEKIGRKRVPLIISQTSGER